MRGCFRVVVAACGIALVLIPAPALAHVGVQAASARPGAETTWQIHVPNESESQATIKVELQLPEGFVFVAGGRNEGWDISAQGDVVTIEGGRIEPGADDDFRIRVQNTRNTGNYTVPAIQTYSGGERVRWTGGDGSDTPAPVLTIAGKPVAAPATESPSTAAPSPEPTVAPSPAPTIAASETEAAAEPSSSATSGTVLAVLAVLAVAGGLFAVAQRRRSSG